MLTALPSRDCARLLLTFACAMRRAEAAALDVADLRYDACGLIVTLRRSKTDQEGQGREIAVPFVANGRLCAATHVRNWLEAAALVDGPVFRTLRLRRPFAARRVHHVGHSDEGRLGGRHPARERAPLRRDLARLRAARQRLRRRTAGRDHEPGLGVDSPYTPQAVAEPVAASFRLERRPMILFRCAAVRPVKHIVRTVKRTRKPPLQNGLRRLKDPFVWLVVAARHQCAAAARKGKLQ
jgi:hypothetical protein